MKDAPAGKLRLTEHYLCAEGEGRTLGALTYLVRLSGCDLRCWWCDSKFSSFFDDEERMVRAVDIEAAALKSGAAWASFTGGEPTWRGGVELKTLAGLCRRLRRKGLKVKFESNGRRRPKELRGVVDLWSLAPKWDGRRKGAQARTLAMDYDEGALLEAVSAAKDGQLQLKFVVTYTSEGLRRTDLSRAVKILQGLGTKATRFPAYFIPEAYAAGDYLARCRALEAAVMRLGKGALKGWELHVQPQMHRVLHGDARRR